MNNALTLNRRKFFIGSAAFMALTPVVLTTTGCNTSWIATAEKDIPVIVNIVTSLASAALTATGNGAILAGALAVINTATQAAQAGLQTLQDIINNLQAQKTTIPSPTIIQKIENVIDTISNDLSNILSSLHLSGGFLNIVTTGIALAISTLSSIQLLLPASSVSSLLALKQKTLNMQINIIDAKTIASQYNAVCVANKYPQHQIALPK